MSENSKISCPHCGKPIDVEDVLASGIEKQLESKYEAKLLSEKGKLETEYKSKVEAEFSGKMKSLENEILEKSSKIQELNSKELDLLRQQRELTEKQGELELAIERQLAEKQKEIEEKVRKTEGDRNEMKMREKDKTIDDLKILLEEMKRKSEQGSMQTQGEVQELALEEYLALAFPFDIIEEVAKGRKGADAIQTVRNNFGQVCGKIVYESKNAQSFSKDWVEKLKNDMRSHQADIAILVTSAMPRNMDSFGFHGGIWICRFSEVRGLSSALRESLLKVHTALSSQENKDDKMHLLYSFLTSNEFRQQIEAIVEGFIKMRNSITSERAAMEKLWKEREKQLDKVLISATGFYGSVKGIAGSSIPDIKLLEGEEENKNVPE